MSGLNHWFFEGGIPKQVLRDVTLTLQPGEIVILTGPSGSGKTTLLTMLGGLRAAQSGSLRILGSELLHADRLTLTRLRRQVGFIFQAHNLMPYLNACENVRLGLEVRSDWLRRGRAAMDASAACATSQTFIMNTDATTPRMGVWPPGAGLQGQAPNHPMPLCPKGAVV
ncbi:MAG: ATP-binding cassette domain-containing protein, partial [Cyanobium sp.]